MRRDLGEGVTVDKEDTAALDESRQSSAEECANAGGFDASSDESNPRTCNYYRNIVTTSAIHSVGSSVLQSFIWIMKVIGLLVVFFIRRDGGSPLSPIPD